MAAVFLSYRRGDAGGHAGRLHDRLLQWFDAEALFYDRDTIVPGQVFPQRLRDAIQAARVVLVLIGPDWVAELTRRAALPEVDFVRQEVALALQRSAGTEPSAVIPILLGGAAPPSVSAMDASLQSELGALCELDMHAFVEGKNADWNNQFVRLRELIAAVPGVPAPRWRPPQGTPQPFRTIEHRLSPHFQDPNELLAQLHKALAESSRAAVISPAAVYGMGGVGKTQLALRYSHSYRDRYAGVWWLRAETPEGLQLDAQACCAAGGAPVPDQVTPSQALKAWLRSQTAPWLLVFDNAEDVQSLREHLPDAGPHHVLITSRNPVWSSLATPVQTSAWSAAQGTAFLTQRLARTAAAHTMSADLESLSQALGGLPLALEQAADYVEATGMAPAEYATLIREASQGVVLLRAPRVPTGYQRSVIATLSLAFERLSARAQLLRPLAYFAPKQATERLFRGGGEQLAATRPKLTATASQGAMLLGTARVATGYERSVIANLSLAFERLSAAAGQLLRLLAYFAPEPVAERLFRGGDEELAAARPELAAAAANPLAWYELVAELRRFGIVEHVAIAGLDPAIAASQGRSPSEPALVLHRLTQEAARCTVCEPAADAGMVMRLLFDALPGDTEHAQHWPLYAHCLPHVSHIDSVAEALNLDAGQHTSLLDRAADYLRSGPALFGRSRSLDERALEIRRRALGEEHQQTLASMNNVANTLGKQGDLAAARRLQEQLLQVTRRVLGEGHPDTLATMSNLATTLHSQGHLAGARKLQERVLAVYRRVLGERHPDTLTLMNNLALTLKDQGDLASARKLQERVLEVQRRVLGGQDARTLTSMNNLACTLLDQGDLAGARKLEEQVLEIRRRALGDDHPNTLTSMNNLAQTLREQGDLSSARTFQEQVLEVERRVLGEEHPNTLTSMNNLAHTLQAIGERSAAVALMDRVVAGRKARLGAQHPDTMNSASALSAWRTGAPPSSN